MHKCNGCEVLIIDVEGAECAIVHSMAATVRDMKIAWPRVVRFETMGHANTWEWPRCEEDP